MGNANDELVSSPYAGGAAELADGLPDSSKLIWVGLAFVPVPCEPIELFAECATDGPSRRSAAMFSRDELAARLSNLNLFFLLEGTSRVFVVGEVVMIVGAI